VELLGSEIVGLVPLKAMLDAGSFFSPDVTDEDALVDAAISGLGLRNQHDFEPTQGIIEWAIKKELNQ